MPAPASPEFDEGSRRYAGWRVVLACFVMAMLCWGFGFYGHGFYLAELQRQHGWPASVIASASTVYYFASAFLVVFVNDAIRRFGTRACVLTGAAALAGSVATLPFIAEIWQLFVVYLIMAFGWATLSLGAITNILGLWFDKRRGLAISLALNGASLGGVVIVPALVFLGGATNFATAMLAGAALILALLVPLALTFLSARTPQSGRAPAGDGALARSPGMTRASALRTAAFWSVSAPFAIALLSQAGFLVHQIAFLEPAIGRYQAGIAVAITTSMAIVGRLLVGTVAERLDQRRASAVSLVSQAAALAVMTQTSSAVALLTACAVYGFSVGNLITFPALIVQREFQPADFGMIVGLSTAVAQFTYAFGPGLLGLVRDASGSYTAALLTCIVLNLAAAALVIARRRVPPVRA